MLTLGQVKNSEVADVSGVNAQDPQFARYVNQAVRQLAELGDWWGTVEALVGLSYRGNMVWPSGVESVLAINAGHRNVRVANHWYEFIPFAGSMAELFHSHRLHNRRESVVRFSGTISVFNPPTPANPFSVQVTADNVVDYGNTVTIYGQDSNGLEVVTTRADGSTQRGVQLTLAAATTFTTQIFSSISAVVKDTTVGIVRLWVYSATSPLAVPVAAYLGQETSPAYLFSTLSASHGIGHLFPIEALVKLTPLDATQDADPILIKNISAIKSMVQSIRTRESGDDESADKQEQTAIRRLNMQLNSRFPDEQFVGENNTFGDVDMHRRTRIF